MFGFGIPLFIDSDDHTHPLKWNLWVIHRLVLTAVYGFILFMYHSKWRERLPGKFVWHMQIVTVVSYQLHDCLILGFFIFFFFFPCSKTCILQLYCYHVLDECSCFISLCTYWKWGWFWVLVIFIQSPSNK